MAKTSNTTDPTTGNTTDPTTGNASTTEYASTSDQTGTMQDQVTGTSDTSEFGQSYGQTSTLDTGATPNYPNIPYGTPIQVNFRILHLNGNRATLAPAEGVGFNTDYNFAGQFDVLLAGEYLTQYQQAYQNGWAVTGVFMVQPLGVTGAGNKQTPSGATAGAAS